jgi:hypothetical protein
MEYNFISFSIIYMMKIIHLGRRDLTKEQAEKFFYVFFE